MVGIILLNSYGNHEIMDAVDIELDDNVSVVKYWESADIFLHDFATSSGIFSIDDSSCDINVMLADYYIKTGFISSIYHNNLNPNVAKYVIDLLMKHSLLNKYLISIFQSVHRPGVEASEHLIHNILDLLTVDEIEDILSDGSIQYDSLLSIINNHMRMCYTKGLNTEREVTSDTTLGI